jgi:hypothetical protein
MSQDISLNKLIGFQREKQGLNSDQVHDLTVQYY